MEQRQAIFISPGTQATAPHYPGNSGDLPGDLQNIVSPQTLDLLRAYAGRYFRQKGRKSTTLGFTHMLDSDQKAPVVMGRGPTRGFTRKMSPAVPGSTRGCTLDITKYKIESPGKSPLFLGSGGPWYN